MTGESIPVKREFENREQILAELTEHLQTAVQLEHSTLPFYFYMYWSLALHPGFKKAPADVVAAAMGIREVIMEEMLHFALVCNILRAVGGTPGINGKWTPAYPDSLPGHSNMHKFVVHLEKCDFNSIITAMRIERPAKPGEEMVNDEYTTIGQFYGHISDLINDPRLTDKDFQKGGQMHEWGGKSDVDLYSNFPVKNNQNARWITIQKKEDAVEALREITEQGEGFQDTLFVAPDDSHLSHFGTFLAIFEAMGGSTRGNIDSKLIHSNQWLKSLLQGNYNASKYHAFQQYVLPLVKDPSQNSQLYTEEGKEANTAFNRIYSTMLDHMHESFNSPMPRVMDFSRMFSLQEAAKKVVQHQLNDGSGRICGPSFEYIKQ